MAYCARPGWRNWWKDDWQGKPKHSKKTCPSAALPTKNPTCWPDAGPGRRCREPATNRLSFTACITEFIGHTTSLHKAFIRHFVSNKLSYAQWNMSELIGILLCSTGKRNSHIVKPSYLCNAVSSIHLLRCLSSVFKNSFPELANDRAVWKKLRDRSLAADGCWEGAEGMTGAFLLLGVCFTYSVIGLCWRPLLSYRNEATLLGS
jgi:hypothetical protein